VSSGCCQPGYTHQSKIRLDGRRLAGEQVRVTVDNLRASSTFVLRARWANAREANRTLADTVIAGWSDAGVTNV
jgi:hypothetical protein